MAGTTVNKPQSLQHAKTIHRPLISFVALSGQGILGQSASIAVDPVAMQALLNTAGRNATPVPYAPSADIDTMGVVTAVGENRVLVYQNGSQNVIQSNTGEEVYGRITTDGTNFTLNFFTLEDDGNETAYTIGEGTYDFFMPYRYSFEKLPDDALIRVKSKRVSDDPAGGGGREVMQIVAVSALNTTANLVFTPVPGSFVWGHVDGHSVDSLPGGAFSVAGKAITWSPATASYDLEISDRFVVHYESFE